MQIQRLSVVIPTWNEAGRIAETLHTVRDYLAAEGIAYEIILSDDGSTDATVGVAELLRDPRIRVLNGAHAGKGSAVKRGVLEARYDWILVTDADLAAPIGELARLSAYREYDVVIGSRAVDGRSIERRQPWYREYGGKLFNRCMQILAVRGVWDTQCGFKLFRREAARSIFSRVTIPGFGFDVEALFIAQKHGLKIREVGIRWSHQMGSKVRFVRDGFRMLAEVVRVRLNEWEGRYTQY
jgi:dolichyl-phosphate beta-glucosyltransferase